MFWVLTGLRSRAHSSLPTGFQSWRGLATRIGKLGRLPEKVDLPGVKAAIAIASGKGGVGKSTTTGKKTHLSTTELLPRVSREIAPSSLVQQILLLPWRETPS